MRYVMLLIVAMSFLACFFYLGMIFEENSAQNTSFEETAQNNDTTCIKKDNLDKFSDFFTPYSYKNKFNIQSDSEEINGTNDELKAQIIALKNQNKILYVDNVDLANKNFEIVSMISSCKQDCENEKKDILNKNIEILNTTESQHYKNINDLTNRLSEIQSKNDEKIVNLTNEISQIRSILVKKDKQISDEIAKNKTLSQENEYLNSKIAKFQRDLNISAVSNTQKDAEISALKQDLQIKSDKINEILQSHAQEVANLENKNIKTLETIKQNYEAKQAKNLQLAQNQDKNNTVLYEERTKFINKIDELNKKIAGLKDQNASILRLKTQIDELNVKFSQKEQEYNKNILEANNRNFFAKLNSAYKEIEELKKDKDHLESKILALVNSLEMATRLSDEGKKDLTLQRYEKKMKEYESKIRNLNQALGDLSNKKRIYLETKKENEILKAKIKNSENLQIEFSPNQTNEQVIQQNTALKADLKAAKDEILRTQKQVFELIGENEKLNKYINGNAKELKSMYEKQVEENKQLKAQNSKRKFAPLDSLTCADFQNGKISDECKNKAEQFFAKYGANFTFEITPINAKAEIDEIFDGVNFKAYYKEKLSNLVKFGISQDKIMAAKELINQKFGEFSHVFVSDNLIIDPVAKGFVIKVYR